MLGEPHLGQEGFWSCMMGYLLLKIIEGGPLLKDNAFFFLKFSVLLVNSISKTLEGFYEFSDYNTFR